MLYQACKIYFRRNERDPHVRDAATQPARRLKFEFYEARANGKR